MPDHESPSTPRWVKVFGIIAVLIVLALAVLLVLGGGSHGPRRHLPSGDPPSAHRSAVEPGVGHG